MDKQLIVILGPTGIGKTDISINIARKLKTEIISADSRQMYRELKIGTAAPTEKQLNLAKHHFVGNLSIHDYYNASKFEFEAIDVIKKLFLTKSKVIMTGGSGLYIDAVCKGIDDLPEIDPDLRKDLLAIYNNEGIEKLWEMLQKLDPEYYSRVDRNNYKRILKGLEISIMTGKPYTTFLTNTIKSRDFEVIMIGLNRDRQELYDIINKRVDVMIDKGLVDEAKALLPQKNLNSLNTVGYKELFDHFDNKICFEKAIELIKRNTRRYAKRQLTWFARDNGIEWFHPDQERGIWERVKVESLKTEDGRRKSEV